MAVNEIEYDGLTLVSVNEELALIVCPKGKLYLTCEGAEALDQAKHLTRMYWDEVACFGEPMYPKHWQNMDKQRIQGLETVVESLNQRLASFEKP